MVAVSAGLAYHIYVIFMSNTLVPPHVNTVIESACFHFLLPVQRREVYTARAISPGRSVGCCHWQQPFGTSLMTYTQRLFLPIPKYSFSSGIVLGQTPSLSKGAHLFTNAHCIYALSVQPSLAIIDEPYAVCVIESTCLISRPSAIPCHFFLVLSAQLC